MLCNELNICVSILFIFDRLVHLILEIVERGLELVGHFAHLGLHGVDDLLGVLDVWEPDHRLHVLQRLVPVGLGLSDEVLEGGGERLLSGVHLRQQKVQSS